MVQERLNPVPITENPHEAELLLSEAPEISLFAKLRQRFGQMLAWASDAKLKIALAAILVPAAAACGGGAKGEGNGESPTIVPPARTAEASSTRVTPTPIPTEKPPTATPDLPKPKPVPLEGAKPILSIPFVPTTIEAVTKDVVSAYVKYPNAYDFPSQGRKFSQSDIERLLGACGTGILDGRSSDSKVECAMLVRIFYGHYLLSGYPEFYTAAVDVFNFFRTKHPENFSSGPLPFIEVVKGELELNKLPTK